MNLSAVAPGAGADRIRLTALSKPFQLTLAPNRQRNTLRSVLQFTDRQFFATAVGTYGVGLLYALLRRRLSLHKKRSILYTILVAGLGFHTLSLVMRGLAIHRCPVTNLYEATAFTAWTIGAACAGLGLVPRLRFLTVFAPPVLLGLGVLALMPPLDTPSTGPPLDRGIVSLHMSLTLLAYGAFGLGALIFAVYLTQEHDLKARRWAAVVALLPPLEELELTGARLLAGGLVLLSGGLLVGMGWLRYQQGVFIKADPKILWAFFVWSLYGLLLVLRWRHTLGARKLAWAAVGSFSFVILTFWGFNLLSDIHHPR